QLVAARAIPVRAFPQILAVDPHFAVAIHAVEFDEDDLAAVHRGHGERLAIPPDAARQRTARHAGVVLLAELAFDTPIVRQVERAPAGIRERGGLCPC